MIASNQTYIAQNEEYHKQNVKHAADVYATFAERQIEINMRSQPGTQFLSGSVFI